MTHSDQTWRRTLRDLCRLGAIGSLVMLILAASSLWNGTGPAAEAASAGPVVVQGGPGTPASGGAITSGGSATEFTFQLPAGAACTNDSTGPGNYRIQSYMVPASVEPSTLRFNAFGLNPAGSGANYRQPLYRSASGQAYINITTGIASVAGGPGLIPTLPGFSFTSTRFVAGFVLPGTYNVGIMCTSATGTAVDKYWNTQLTFATSATDLPNGLTWEVTGGTTTTTTTTTVAAATTTTVAAATTTTVAGAATTTVAAATTTTVAGATTTTVAGAATTTVAGATTTTVAGAAGGTVTPTAPTPGGAYTVTYPNCRVGETVTFSQLQSTPASVTATCAAPSGLLRPAQAAGGNATASFTAAPRTAGSYTVNMVGSVSGTKTATFVITTAASPVAPAAPIGGSPSGSSTGTIPATGSSTTAVVVWGILLLVFGRMAILLGRTPRVISTGR